MSNTACIYTRGQKVVVDKTLIVSFVRELPDFQAIVETGAGSLVVSQTRLSLEREEVDE